MAASSSSRGIATVGKRIADQIWTRSSPLASRRAAAHSSAYDKNPDDNHPPSHAVPDELIQSTSDKYWGPDPRTGVFGPVSGAGGGTQGAPPSNGGEGSVLEQKAWFRPTSIEDLEKPAMP